MKKYLILIIILLISIPLLFTVTTSKMVKRTILILPFVNKNGAAEFDYLSGIISDSLFSELTGTDLYEFVNFSTKSESLSGYNKKDFADTKIAGEIAQIAGANAVIMGQYVISNGKIMIIMNALDLFSGDIAALTKAEGNTGIGLFDVINSAAKDMTAKLTQKLPMMEKKDYDKKKKSLIEKDAKKTSGRKYCIAIYYYTVTSETISPGYVMIDDGNGRLERKEYGSCVKFIEEMKGKGWTLSRPNSASAGDHNIPYIFMFFEKF
jgi:TolB-like protein